MTLIPDLLKLCWDTISTTVEQWQEKDITPDVIYFPLLLSSLLDEHLFHSISSLLKNYEDKIPNLGLDIIFDQQLCVQKKQSLDLSNLSKLNNQLTLANIDFPSEAELENKKILMASIKSLLLFARETELNLIIDNIATEKQQAMLLDNGCKIMVGSYFAPPLSTENLVDFYQNYS